MTSLEKRYALYLAGSTLVLLALCIPGSPLSVRAATRSALQSGAEGSQRRPPAVDRTTPILQTMTPAQRHHSQLFKEFSGPMRLLDELVNKNVFRDRVVSSEPVPLSDFARELRCAADSVFVGTVEGRRSLPTEDGTFIFTEYTVVVTETIDTGPNRELREGARVTILQPGGSIQIGEHTTTAFVSDVPELGIGAAYVFFATRIAATGAYRSAHHEGTVSLTDDTARVRSLPSFSTSEGDLARGIAKDLFLTEVRGIGPCK